jgi:hypothetical protein
VLVAEQELAIEVAEIDGVQVYHGDIAKAGEDEVLEEFAADATSERVPKSHQQMRYTFWRLVVATSLMR